mgnify:CR=1 FL=1
MYCPKCGSSQIFVTNSRHKNSINAIRRRRKCNSCGYVWSTLEQTVEQDKLSILAHQLKAICKEIDKL